MAESTPVQLSLIGADTEEAADQAARDDIVSELDLTLFVEAGAGSGKTRALVDRVEALVAAGIPMESIAAITFTEKAAAELRDRIRRRFEERIASDDDRSIFESAVEQLDGAAVGTLHSFAQRLLGEHPVEAGLPPGVEVLDEIGSQVEFEARWLDFVDRLLDDDQLGRSLLLLESASVRIDHLRALALTLGANWDLVQERLDLDQPDPAVVEPAPIIGLIRELGVLAAECTDDGDRLLERINELRALGEALAGDEDETDRLDRIRHIASRCRVGNVGSKDNWGGDVVTVRDSVAAVGSEASRLVDEISQQALHRLVGAIGRFTLESAEERRAQGRLEFHDLLVRARRLLRNPLTGPHARRSVRTRYQRLLIDEFQDTDPIQVDLAMLIASPDEALDRPWTEMPVDEGRLFFVGDPKQSIYRFRRADISVYLAARERFPDRRDLTRNFRTVAPVIDWINHVFASLIEFQPGSQPAYVALEPTRHEPPPVGPAMSVLGATAIDESLNAEELRVREADSVARAVSTALDEGWAVQDDDDPVRWRPARPGDICILLPARTSLPALERALDAVSIPYRAETSSLVYTTREVRDVLLAMRAVADPTDELATVAALRSAVYGCGDDDLAHWRLGYGGRFTILAPLPDDAPADHPVAEGLAHMAAMHEARLWSSPSQLLDRLIRDRGVLESATVTHRPRDVWRRLRFVVDQARAWADAGGTDLRAYLEWARLQGADNARVTETVLPETDDDSVRILTIHGAKGLEFPITVLAGMTTELRRPASGPTVAFPADGDPVVRVKANVQSEAYEVWKPIDEQMDHHERLRLLYVAATRARDHLIVSLIRTASGRTTGAAILNEAGATAGGAVSLDPGVPPPPSRERRPPVGLLDRDLWLQQVQAALAESSRRRVIAATTLAREAAEAATADAGLAKRERDLELPPWVKGRYGTAVGRAVHGVLQLVDLASGDGLTELASAQAAAEGVVARGDVVRQLAASALTTEVARQASRSQHWRELFVAATIGERLIEGYVDLVYRSPAGLVVVDWKTDHVAGDDDVGAKLDRYRLQGASYVAALEAATGQTVDRMVFVFLSPDGATEADLPALPEAVAEVRRGAESGHLDDLVVSSPPDR